jgi:hypothetical protein
MSNVARGSRTKRKTPPKRGFREIFVAGSGLLVGLLFDVFDDITHALEFLGVFVGNFDSEFFLEGHDEFDSIQRIGAEVFNERCRSGDLFGIHAKLVDNDIFDFFFDGFFGHEILELGFVTNGRLTDLQPGISREKPVRRAVNLPNHPTGQAQTSF